MSAEPALPPVGGTFDVARSFSGKRWRLRACDETLAQDISRDHGISIALSRILAARAIGRESIAEILQPTLKKLLPEPLILKDMERAVARTRAAIENGEKIAVFGDYDVDGSSSAALLSGYFSAIGIATRIYIPDRMTEGYGPNEAALLRLKAEGIGLVLTVDCGAGAAAPLAAARAAGLDVIVLDHHAVEVPPPAFAHVNPNQPGDNSGLGHVCAAGIAFLFAVALNRSLRDGGWFTNKGMPEPDLRHQLDLVALATICDVVPLTGVNRAFVRAGLARMSERTRIGLASLANVAKLEPPFTPYHLGFLFGPRINAGGRVGKCSLGAELLSASDAECAHEIASLLEVHNRERQAIEANILDAAMLLGEKQDNLPFVLVGEQGWHPGVVGIVASRLKDKFEKPAFVAGFQEGSGRGSARSVPGFDIGRAVRRAREAGILYAGGGHAMAAGFSLALEKLESFRNFLIGEFADAGLAPGAPDLEIDVLVSPRSASVAMAEEVALAGPFGAGNPEPVIGLVDVRVVFADRVGRDHVRFRVAGGDGARLDAIAFRAADSGLGEALLAARGRRIHVVGRLRKNEWNGQVRVQLQADDAAPAEL